MTARNAKTPDQPPRLTYRLGLTYLANPTHLDYKSRLSLDWTSRWIQDHGGLRAPHSGIVRRALLVYVKHLESLGGTDAPGELRAIKAACAGTYTSPDDMEAAEARLEASKGSPLPPFLAVLEGQHVVDARDAMVRSLEPLNHIPPTRARPRPAITPTEPIQ